MKRWLRWLIIILLIFMYSFVYRRRMNTWGAKGIESSRFVKVVEGDIVQTFRNFINSILTHQVKKRMRRDGILILLDEFDVIKMKKGLGSLIKSFIILTKEYSMGQYIEYGP